MPRGDGTGPAGFGPMSGRAAGYCAGFGVPGYLNPVPGRGSWWGGRGWRHWFYATGLPGWARFGWPAMSSSHRESEKESLQAQADMLQSRLDQIQQRIKQLEQDQSK